MGAPETEKLLQNKGHSQQDKIAAYTMRTDLQQHHIRHRADLQNIQRNQEIDLQKKKIIQ